MCDAKMKTDLFYTPNTLILLLNRGQGLQFNVPLQVNDSLDLSNYVLADKESSYYDLVSIVCHMG